MSQDIFFNTMVQEKTVSLDESDSLNVDRELFIKDLLRCPFDTIEGVYHVSFSDFSLENCDGLLILSSNYLVLAPSVRCDAVRKGLFRLQGVDFKLAGRAHSAKQFLHLS